MILTHLMIVVHVAMCMALILIILLQTGKGSGMGAAFGGSSSTLFGSTGRASFLTKVTIAAAVVFALTSMGLSLIGPTSTGVADELSSEMPVTPPTTDLGAPPAETPGVDANVTGTPGEGAPPADVGLDPAPEVPDTPAPEPDAPTEDGAGSPREPVGLDPPDGGEGE